MILTHWHSDTPLPPLYNVEQVAPEMSIKPKGFWLSDEGCEDSWSSWCDAESFGIGQHRTDFNVDMSNVLHLRIAADLLDFTTEYEAQVPVKIWCRRRIDWQRVAKSFAGILITPYIWSLRLDDRTDWYYGWDCASGCFWDVSCLSPVTEAEAA